MQGTNWIAMACGGLLGLGIAVGFLTALQPSVAGTPPVSAGVPAAPEPEVAVDLSERDPLERLLPSEPQRFYQYIDDDGGVRFVPSLHEVPESWRARAGRVELAARPPDTPASARMLRKLARRADEAGAGR